VGIHDPAGHVARDEVGLVNQHPLGVMKHHLLAFENPRVLGLDRTDLYGPDLSFLVVPARCAPAVVDSIRFEKVAVLTDQHPPVHIESYPVALVGPMLDEPTHHERLAPSRWAGKADAPVPGRQRRLDGFDSPDLMRPILHRSILDLGDHRP
jgi:hypothetical protein